ncbi:MAG: hypothetical protein ACYCZX_14975 [Rhodospirillaceae bacterium]
MTFKHPDVLSAELIDEPEGNGKIAAVLSIVTELDLIADAPNYDAERIAALVAAVEQYKSNNPQVDRVCLASAVDVR